MSTESQELIKCQLAEIEARTLAATPGPWEHGCDDSPADNSIEASSGGVVAFVQPYANIRTIIKYNAEFSHQDARFIAHSRTDIPFLIATIRSAWNEIESLREEKRDLCYELNKYE